ERQFVSEEHSVEATLVHQKYKYEQKAWGRYSVMQKDVMERKNLINGMGHKTEFSAVAGAKLVSIVIWTAHC
ncbi:hypothetical protein D5086_016631, partial [Populus alba]